MKFIREYYALGLAALVAFGGIQVLSDKSHLLDRKFLVPPPQYIERMAFGFNSSVADSLWLRWIQDADTCYGYLSAIEMNPGASGFADGSTVDQYYNPRHKKCDDSWGFKMLDAVTLLDPKFKMPYLAGTMALSVLVEDFKGTTVLFNRGLQVYPDDWDLNYRASYHFLFDNRDYARAAALLSHAADTGGPSWLKSLAARLFSETGQIELGLRALITFRETYKEGHPGLVPLDKRIAELKSKLADKHRQAK